MNSPEIATEIAKQLHRIHQVEVPCSKEPQLWNDISNFLEKNLAAASNLIFNDKGKQARYETISFKEVLEEVNALKCGMSDERSLSRLSIKSAKPRQHDLCVHTAASRIQNKFRGWKGREKFLII